MHQKCPYTTNIGTLYTSIRLSEWNMYSYNIDNVGSDQTYSTLTAYT